MLFFGELRAQPHVSALLKRLVYNHCKSTGTVHLVLQHFSFEMQYLLNDFSKGVLSWPDLLANYKHIGTESHDIRLFRSIFGLARANLGRINLHAGVMPWPFAALGVRPIGGMGEELALKLAKSRDYVA